MAADPITADAAAELLNYDMSDDEPFNDNPQTKSRDDKATLSPRGTKRKNAGDDNENALGLDEEVKITKKRKPAVKLDEARLLSAPGIPKLREIARSSVGVARKLRMKGKGHEFSDVARLLNFYQLWLDGLFPRAKFADGLQLIEKAGHSKRMQVMRKEWIDEGKPGYIKPGTELVESILNGDYPLPGHAGYNGQPTRTLTGDEPPADEGDGMFFPSPSKKSQQETIGGLDPDDDELDALLAAQEEKQIMVLANQNAADDSECEDDLDALLAEQESRLTPVRPAPEPLQPDEDDDDDDDLDALLAEQEARFKPQEPSQAVPVAETKSSSRPSSSHSVIKAKKRTIFDDDTESEGENDLDALLAEQSARQQKSTPPTSPSQSATDAPSLPEPPKQTLPTGKDESQSSIAKVFSSSPIRNSSQKDGLATKPYSSSPLPNNPEEEDDLDALLAESGM